MVSETPHIAVQCQEIVEQLDAGERTILRWLGLLTDHERTEFRDRLREAVIAGDISQMYEAILTFNEKAALAYERGRNQHRPPDPD